MSMGWRSAMADLPTGTVTFLFTDIAGSTALWEHHPDAARVALARHDVLVEQIVAAHDGRVVRPRGEGDSRFAVFARATDAVTAAAALQQAFYAEPWPTPTPLQVRMALHTGEADLWEGDYYGTAVNRCARLRAVAHGGQTVLSQATFDLVCDHSLHGVDLRDLGQHRLKDLQRPEHIYQLVIPGLPADFPLLTTLDARPTNLPVQPTPFIGREQEVAVVRACVLRPEMRLLTLTGPGGTGKTRLALQVAADLLDAFPDGVYFVDLAPISDPALVATTIATTLGVREIGGPLIAGLKAYLAAKHLLLLLDNFEQVLAAAPLVADLLTAAPHLKVLVTSRTVSHLQGEHEVPVPPLTLPDPQHLPQLDQLSQYAAVALFIQRAQAAKPDFQVTNANAPAVAEICYRLDGLPLAIELAAARIKLLPPPLLLTRLTQRLQVLTGGARDLPARQQTLRRTIDWSYNLLDAGEQQLFRRLGVFVGGATLEAVEAVSRADSDGAEDVLGGLQALVDQSLLQVADEPEGAPRFTMLETIREYALEQLQASGEEERIQQQHVLYFLALAEAIAPKLHGPDEPAAFQRLEAEHDNLRAALAWSLAHGDPELGLRIGVALRWFWGPHGYVREGRSWLDRLLAAQTAPVALPVRAAALLAAGGLSRADGDLVSARGRWDHSLRLYQELGDKQGIARVLLNLGTLAGYQGEHGQAQALCEESLALFQALGDKHGRASALHDLAWLVQRTGDYPRARELSEESLQLFREVGDLRGIASALDQLGFLVHEEGEIEHGTALIEEALAIFRDLGQRRGIADMLNVLGAIAYHKGDFERAWTRLEESLALFRAQGDPAGAEGVLHNLGVTASYQGDLARARMLLEESMEMARALRHQRNVALGLRELGTVARRAGDLEQAMRLYQDALI